MDNAGLCASLKAQLGFQSRRSASRVLLCGRCNDLSDPDCWSAQSRGACANQHVTNETQIGMRTVDIASFQLEQGIGGVIWHAGMGAKRTTVCCAFVDDLQACFRAHFAVKSSAWVRCFATTMKLAITQLHSRSDNLGPDLERAQHRDDWHPTTTSKLAAVADERQRDLKGSSFDLPKTEVGNSKSVHSGFK